MHMIAFLLVGRANHSSMPFLVEGFSLRNLLLMYRRRTKVEMCTMNAIDMFIFNSVVLSGDCFRVYLTVVHYL